MAFCTPGGKGAYPAGVTLPDGTFTFSSLRGASSDCPPIGSWGTLGPVTSGTMGIPVKVDP